MKGAAVKTVNLAEVLRRGTHFGVFVDDTGSPGLDTPGLSADRKSWVAVLVAPSQVSEVMDGVPSALEYLRRLGIREPEFHFTDILAGKNSFSGVDLQSRLAIFEFMAAMFSKYQFEVLVQTLDAEEGRRISTRSDWPTNFGALRSSSHEDLALMLLLLRVRKRLAEMPSGPASACVIVDEGRLGHSRSIVLPGLAPMFHEGAVYFARSRDVHPVQLADFAGFVMNRWQLLRVKPKLSDLDKAFLKIVTPIAENFLNLDRVEVHNVDEISNLRQGMN